MATAYTKTEINEIIRLSKEELRLREKIGGSYKDYIESIKDYRKIQKEINKGEAEFKKLVDASGQPLASLNEDEYKRYQVLKETLKLLNQQNKVLEEAIKKTSALEVVGSKMLANSLKFTANLPNLYLSGVDKIKGLLAMEKAIKTSALQMGILSKQSGSFRNNIVQTSKKTNLIGIGTEELAKMQASYGEELGRNVLMTSEGLKGMAEMAVVTGLGAEGTSRMAVDMQNQGLSAERTKDFIEGALNSSHKMGLNATKVVKNISGGIKLLNKYNFKDGVQGLAKMAQTVAKLGVSMEFATGMAEKLFDIEGAVDMSAQLQTMGGEWAKLADPFKLMYMARNDMEGLTAALGKAAESAVTFNKQKGEFVISGLEMHRLRKIAEQTGVSYEELAEAGKNAAKFTEIKKQLNFNIQDKELAEFIASTAEIGKDGQAKIMLDSKPKLIKDLNATNVEALKTLMKETANMEERAKQSQNFDEALAFTFNSMKVSLLPFIDVLNKKLLPKIEGIMKTFDKEKWGQTIETFAASAGEMIGAVGGFILEWPKVTASLILAAKVGLFDIPKWIMNGRALAIGFKMGTTGFGGTGTGGSRFTPGTDNNKKMMTGLKVGGGLSLLGMGVDIANQNEVFGEKGSTGSKYAGVGAKALEYGGVGAMLGSVIPGVGTAIGGGIGALVGGIKGAYDEGIFGVNPPAQDTASFAGNKSGYNTNRAILGPNGITPIPDKESFVSMKKGGAIENMLNNKASVATTAKIEHSPIVFSGKITLESPGSPGISVDLLKNQSFIAEMTKIIHSQTEVMGKGNGKHVA